MDKEAIIKQYDFNLRYAKALVGDIPSNQMTLIPAKGLENHPAFTIGHLVTASAMTAEDLGEDQDLPEGWDELFARRGPGDPRYPEIDEGQYPGKDELLAELERQHERVVSLIRNKATDELKQSIKWRFDRYMPSLGDVVHFMCVTHEAMHLSQLAAWRRNLGFPSALDTL